MHSKGSLDPGYYADLGGFIEGLPNITHWVHGHTHIQHTYKIHQCQVFSNARGYCGREWSDTTFETNRFFEI
jgi:hypothetical protein